MEKRKKRTTENFVEDAKKVHGNKYDYSQTDYNKKDEKGRIRIICPEHGEFWQTPDNHLKGKGCKKCSTKKKPQCQPVGKDAFVEKAKSIHGDKYDYSLVDYINGLTEVKIICPIHGVFYQKPQNHLAGCGCQKCGKEKSGLSQKWDTDQFINEAKNIHGNKYDYSLIKYVNADTPVDIICPKHGIFHQTPYKHIRCHHGCQICKSSSIETEVRVLLEKNGIEYIPQKKFNWLISPGGNPMSYDFYLPDKNIAIECQGLQHFEPCDFFGGEEEFKKTTERDLLKMDLSKKNGVKLIYFSTLNISFPYKVITDKKLLMDEIK